MGFEQAFDVKESRVSSSSSRVARARHILAPMAGAKRQPARRGDGGVELRQQSRSRPTDTRTSAKVKAAARSRCTARRSSRGWRNSTGHRSWSRRYSATEALAAIDLLFKPWCDSPRPSAARLDRSGVALFGGAQELRMTLFCRVNEPRYLAGMTFHQRSRFSLAP